MKDSAGEIILVIHVPLSAPSVLKTESQRDAELQKGRHPGTPGTEME